MKRDYFKILSLFITVVVLVAACEKPDIQKANDDYDWGKVVPKILGMSGPSATSASGLAAVTYKVTGRGGSTYNWEIVNWTGTIEPNAVNPYAVDITFAQASVDTACLVTVYETTHAGVDSEKDTIAVSLAAFCPKQLSDFAGTWVGTETGSSVVDPLTVTIRVSGEQLVVENLSPGIPGFLSQVFIGWGEAFQDGFGNEGEIYLNVNLLSGGITVPKIYWGQTLPGPYDYWQTGTGGTWNGCGDFTIKLNYGLDWDGTGTARRSSNIVLVKQ